MQISELLALEEGFWHSAGNREGYSEGLARNVVHVLPRLGVAGPEQVLAGVAEARPWKSFSIDEPRLVHLGADAAALVYTATARRPEADEYRAAVTSVYVREGAAWRLTLHQQTPLAT